MKIVTENSPKLADPKTFAVFLQITKKVQKIQIMIKKMNLEIVWKMVWNTIKTAQKIIQQKIIPKTTKIPIKTPTISTAKIIKIPIQSLILAKIKTSQTVVKIQVN